MSIQHSRSKVVPSLWQSVFDREFAQVERMFMPGALYEIMPLSARPFFSPPLPESGVFGVGDTIEYFKTIRDKLLSDATKGFELKDTSQGENSLTARYVTQGRDDKGPFDVSHTLFLEFDPQSDKITRGVEYLDSESMQLHLKRDPTKQEWQEQQQQKSVEGTASASASAGQQQQQVENGATSKDQQQQQPQEEKHEATVV